jgi:hypothetical protein
MLTNHLARIARRIADRDPPGGCVVACGAARRTAPPIQRERPD